MIYCCLYPVYDLETNFAGTFSLTCFDCFIGGTKAFTHNAGTYDKWVLNRPFQAKISDSLLHLAEFDKDTADPRKCLRPNEVKKSEASVQKIKHAMKDTFINSLSSDLDPLKLFNLASGKPLPNDVVENLLSYEERGWICYQKFDKRLVQAEVPTSLFLDPIKRNS